jgi:hypothetical protein
MGRIDSWSFSGMSIQVKVGFPMPADGVVAKGFDHGVEATAIGEDFTRLTGLEKRRCGWWRTVTRKLPQ